MLCGKILGDIGADVIKIEPPGGEPARNIGPFYKDIPDPEKSLYWFAFNTSKRGTTLDIENPQGRDIFRKLVQTADFVIESFEPGYMASLGLDYPALEKINPGIIMTSITPFGQTGPHAHHKAYDMIAWAMGGYMYVTGDPPPGPPYRISLPQSGLLGSLHAAMATMIAYYHREVTGEGQHIDTSMQEASIYPLNQAAEIWDFNHINVLHMGDHWLSPRPSPPGIAYTRIHYPCKGGTVSYMLGGGGQMGLVMSSATMVEWADSEGMAGDLKDFDWRTYNGSQITQEELDNIYEVILKFTATKTKEELFQKAVEKAMILAPVNSAKDVVESPQIAAREFLVPVEHPELGDSITYPGAPVKLSDATWKISRRAPLIGEHNSEIYQGELGYSGEEVARLKSAGII